jgi:hypothetical protein
MHREGGRVTKYDRVIHTMTGLITHRGQFAPENEKADKICSMWLANLAARFPGLYMSSSSRSATRVSSMSLAEPGDRNWQSS